MIAERWCCIGVAFVGVYVGVFFPVASAESLGGWSLWALAMGGIDYLEQRIREAPR